MAVHFKCVGPLKLHDESLTQLRKSASKSFVASLTPHLRTEVVLILCGHPSILQPNYPSQSFNFSMANDPVLILGHVPRPVACISFAINIYKPCIQSCATRQEKCAEINRAREERAAHEHKVGWYGGR